MAGDAAPRSQLKTPGRLVDPRPVAERPIDRALFRPSADGATVFFPFGLAHRGYRLPDDAAKEKAARAASLLVGVTLAIGTWTAYRLQDLFDAGPSGGAGLLGALGAPAAAMALAIACYWLWATRFVEGLPESDLRVSRADRLRGAAEVSDPRAVAAIGVSIAAMGGLLTWLEPRAWWLGMAGVAIGVALLCWSAALGRAASAAHARSLVPGSPLRDLGGHEPPEPLAKR